MSYELILTGSQTSQAKGQSLLRLVCTEMEGGLLGKTLLTLVSTRGITPGDEALPAHKFSPHDVVALRDSKGGGAAASSAAGAGGGGGVGVIAQGIVYRVTDNSIVIAVDELPDDSDALQSHLRLDKLANQVSAHIVICTA